MGRMTPVPVESGYRGSSAGAVAAQYLEAQRARYMDCGQRTQSLRDQAEQWLARFPEFADTDGRPCPFAIEIALSLRATYGKQVNKTMVLRAWQQHMARLGKEAA